MGENGSMNRSALLWSGIGALVVVLALGVALTAAGPDVPSMIDSAWNDLMLGVHASVLVEFAQVMNVIGGGWIATYVIPLVIAAALLIARRWRAAIFALLAFIVSAAVVQLLKNLFGRARPEEMLVHSDFGSFPSGHTANAATIAAVAWLLLPRLWTALAGALWVLLMAFSRTVLSVHWLTDTLGGTLVGIGTALVLGAILLPWVRRQQIGTPGTTTTPR